MWLTNYDLSYIKISLLCIPIKILNFINIMFENIEHYSHKLNDVSTIIGLIQLYSYGSVV